MMTGKKAVLLSALGVLVLCGCEPRQAEEDEIQKTLRMAEEARRQTRPGRGGKSNNVYISVERVQVAARDAAGLGALWEFTSGRLAVSGGNGLARGGVRLGMAGSDFEARLSACARRAKTLRRTSTDITVLSGYQGYLWVGRSVMVPELRIISSSGEAVVLRRARLGTALLVRPRVLADGNIELELSPFFSAPKSGRKFTISAMRTRVVVKPGQKLVLGADSSSRRGSVAAGLFGYSSSGSRAATIVTVRAVRL